MDLSIPIDISNFDQLHSLIHYSLAAFFNAHGFVAHAERIAQYCLNQEILCEKREIASQTCLCLRESPPSAVKLALLNKLHTHQDIAFNVFNSGMLLSRASHTSKNAAMIEYYSSSINEHKMSGGALAPLYYSLGSFCRTGHEYSKAVSAYNAARKHDREYLRRDYFWYELGGMSYTSGKYIWAKEAYRKAYDLNKSELCVII